MPKINTIFLISHTHTDIGYTDHQDTVFRQHLEFIDRAIELGEATTDYPPEARYKWTCEVSSFVERYFQERPARQVDRFIRLHQRGQMAVAAMAYHWTPMLSTAGMIRSLFPVMRLRNDFGLTITSAMQCDVNGASWLWADLLPAIGIHSFTMSINMHRGRRPEPDLNAFWWEGPGSGRLLTFNGPHYLYGIFRYGLGDEKTVEEHLPDQLRKLEGRDDYPYDFLYAQVTHPARVDNGPPLSGLADFVRDWNDRGCGPRMVIITLDDFTRMLHERYASALQTWRGDWADWWADGVGSSIYETSLNRATEELLPALDLLATQIDHLDSALVEEAYNLVSLYDEHTWGGFASIRRPHSPFTRANNNRKASYAYNGYGLTHELLATGGRAFARKIAGVTPEGDAWRRWGQYLVADPSADPTAHHFLVVNTLPWTRHVRWPLPPDMGGAAPYASLEMFLVGNYRERPPLEADAPPEMMIDVTLPSFGYRVVRYETLDEPVGVAVGEGILENPWYRIEVDPATGGLKSWFDKEANRELAGHQGAWRLGQYIYEWIDHPADRRALFALDFSREDFGIRHTDTPFRRRGPDRIEVMPAHIQPDGLSVELRLQAPGAKSIRVRYTLPHHEKALYIDMVVDKEFVLRAEAVYVVFPFDLDNPQFHLDLNGVPLEPESEQLPGSCRDWYGIHRWAEVNDGEISITLAPIDAPLIQVGGITTGRWAHHLDTRQATLVSWALHNHWDTNFKASQGEDTLLRYRLTSQRGYDPAASSRFAMEAMIPPIIVRVPGAEVGAAGQFLTVSPEGVAEVQIKRAADGRGISVHAYNLTEEAQEIALTFPALQVAQAWQCSPIEDDLNSLPITNGTLKVSIPTRSVACVRVMSNGDR
jgi:alpha-mannosidase